jgi:hypothetical protein
VQTQFAVVEAALTSDLKQVIPTDAQSAGLAEKVCHDHKNRRLR